MYLSQIARQISINFFDTNEAPPTNAPSTPSIFKISDALLGETLPPYKILISKCGSPIRLLRHFRINLCVISISTILAA